MVMTWNAEADAKLFLGVLNQLKDAKLKLDHEKLAEFMGPDCIPGAISNRINRLRKAAESQMGGAAATPAGSPSGATKSSGQAGEENDEEAGSLGKGSPQKRKAVGKPRGGGAGRGRGGKKAKSQTHADMEAGAASDSDDLGEKMDKTESAVKDEVEVKTDIKHEDELALEKDIAARMIVGDDEIA
ncbi:hypothetical protein BDV18DRAFT_164203 [Aspergillus unguis]